MSSIFSLATLLVRKLRSASPSTRARIDTFIQEIKTQGVIPMGLAKDASGRETYWWVVYDGSHFASHEALLRYVESRSPTGYTVAVLTV